MTTAYLATPIDLHANPNIPVVRDEIRSQLFQMGFSAVFDPSSAWAVNPNAHPNQGLQAVNLAALQASTALVAYLPPGVPTLGVPLEIHIATSMGKPTLIVGGSESSWTLAWFARTDCLFRDDELEGFVAAVAGAQPRPRDPDDERLGRAHAEWERKQARVQEMGR